MMTPVKLSTHSLVRAQQGHEVFALAPRLDFSWRGFYFSYFSHPSNALYAMTDRTS